MNYSFSALGSRELSLLGGGTVVVAIGTPTIEEGEDDYRCNYEITGLRTEEKGRVFGSDALQALQLALVRIGAILYTSEEWKDDLLTWNGDAELGFPLPDSLKDLKSGSV